MAQKITTPSAADASSVLPPTLPFHYGGKRVKNGKIEWEKVPDLDPSQALFAVETLRIRTRVAAAARDVAISSGEGEFKRNFTAYAAAKNSLDELVEEGGLSLEKAHREYVKHRAQYSRWMRMRREMMAIDAALEGRSSALAEVVVKDFMGAHAGSPLDADVLHYLAKKRLGGAQSARELDLEQMSAGEMRKNLQGMVPEGMDTKELEEILGAEEHDKLPEIERRLKFGSRKELLERKAFLDKEVNLWWRTNPMLWYFAQQETVERLVQGLEAGEQVLEIPHTIGLLNKLYEIEVNNPETTIGAVLVGPPGSGKTTLCRYFLAETGRRYAYIDLSGDITRYGILGSKSVEMDNPVRAFLEVSEALGKLDDDGVLRLIEKGRREYGDAFLNLTEDVATGREGSHLSVEDKKRLRSVLEKGFEERFAEVLTDEVYRLGKKNGWRDGFVIHCLRNSICPIFDEFNRARDLSWAFGLLTAVPAPDEIAMKNDPRQLGDEAKMRNPRGWFYFADNNEWMRVPERWRIYFTGNIGSVHQVYAVPPAIRSRMEGKVVEVGFPPSDQEMMVAHANLCDPTLAFRLPHGIAEGLRILIGEVFPHIRGLRGAGYVHPVSLRTIRDICAQLYDRKTETPKASSVADLDRAALNVVVDVYSMEEKRENARSIVEHLTQVGLLLTPEAEPQVIDWLCDNPHDAGQRENAKQELDKKRESHAELIQKLEDAGVRDTVRSALLKLPSPDDVLPPA